MIIQDTYGINYIRTINGYNVKYEKRTEPSTKLHINNGPADITERLARPIKDKSVTPIAQHKNAPPSLVNSVIKNADKIKYNAIVHDSFINAIKKYHIYDNEYRVTYTQLMEIINEHKFVPPVYAPFNIEQRSDIYHMPRGDKINGPDVPDFDDFNI